MLDQFWANFTGIRTLVGDWHHQRSLGEVVP